MSSYKDPSSGSSSGEQEQPDAGHPESKASRSEKVQAEQAEVEQPEGGQAQAGQAQDDDARLQALRRYDVVGTDPEPDFDRITRVAASLFEVPIALINFIAAEREWRKSAIGAESGEQAPKVSFCREAVQSSGTTIIEDAAETERFAGHPLVEDPPGVRFYAGAPLQTPGGHRIGTLCVLDTVPRRFSEEETSRLEDLAGMVMSELERRREAKRRIQEKDRRLQSITENVSDGIYRSTAEAGIVYANSAFVEMFGYQDLEELRATERETLYANPDRREELIEKEAKEKGLSREEVRYRRKDGTTFIGLLSTQRVEGEEQEKTYFDGAITDVTERIEERQRREQAIRRTTDGIVEVGPEWRITLVNEQAEKVYGMDEEEMLGRSAWKVFPKLEDTPFEETYREVMQTREASSIEGYYSALEEWFDVQIYPNEDGGLAFYFDVITERKEREHRLAITSQRLEAILQHTSRPMFVKNREGEHLLTNRRFRELFDLEEGEALGRTAEEFLPPGKARGVQENDRAVLQEGKTVEREEQIRVDGEWRTYLTAKSPLYDIGTEKDPSRPVALFGTATDITDRKRREQELKQADTLFEHAQDALFMIDVGAETDENRTYTVQRVNPAYEEKTDLSASELIGKTPEEIVGPEVGGQIEARYERVASEQIPLEYKEELPIGEGTTHWSTRIAPVVANGETQKIVGTTRDVTAQKRREKRLAEAKKEAEAANRMKSAFLATMSHEIRTPLTSILGFAEAIGEEVQGAEHPEELDVELLGRFSKLIEEGGRRLLETLNAVLNLSKLEAGQMELEAEPVDLAKQARQVVQEHHTQAEEKGLKLRTRLADSPTWAEADEGGVQIVLQNLLSNAIKYTEEGSIEVRTYLGGEEAAVLEVEDTGIGMDPELAEGLFEPFRQASEGVSREYEGTGVGLAVTREAAEKMGGSVEVDTQKGEGSRFTIRLPRASLAG